MSAVGLGAQPTLTSLERLSARIVIQTVMSEERFPCPCGCGAELVGIVHEREVGVRADSDNAPVGPALSARDYRAVLLLSGLPGAGKSTVARQLALRFDRAAHIDIDMVFHHFTISGLVHPNDHTQRDEADRQSLLAMRNAAALAANYYDAGYFVILEGAVAELRLVGECARLIAPRRLHLVVLAPTREETDRRDARRTGKTVADAYAHLRPMMREQLGDHGIWLDSTSWSASQTVEEILSTFGAMSPASFSDE